MMVIAVVTGPGERGADLEDDNDVEYDFLADMELVRKSYSTFDYVRDSQQRLRPCHGVFR